MKEYVYCLVRLEGGYGVFRMDAFNRSLLEAEYAGRIVLRASALPDFLVKLSVFMCEHGFGV